MAISLWSAKHSQNLYMISYSVTNLLGAIAAYCLFPKKPCINAQRTIDDAIKDIDATISKLQKVRAELVSSENNLRLATKDTEELTIRKLTYNNPTMKAKFDEARNAQAAVEITDDEEQALCRYCRILIY